MAETILIKNGRVIDPANNLDTISDILIEGGKIAKIGKNITAEASQYIDASNKIVLPGIVDMHVHLREPGREDKETIDSGSRAALKGGVTSVLAMPNTEPAIDSIQSIGILKEIIKRSAKIDVFISAAITLGRQGNQLVDMKALKDSGAIAITDDGASVEDEAIMYETLKMAKKEGLLVIAHCEDRELSAGGMVNAGFTATRMGLRGISKESEYLRVKRDIAIAEKANARLHIAHISCAESVEIIAKAKKRGAQVTCETAPHYFSLTEEAVLGYDTNMKMNPPLRGSSDRLAIVQGLSDGVIDAIASDHAPHTDNEKEIEFERAEFGVIGLETILAVSITELLVKGALDWSGLAEKLALNPARILGIDKGTLGIGRSADITIVLPQEEWLVEKKGFVSQSKNSPYIGKRLKGKVAYTIYSGMIAYSGISKNQAQEH
ncbi:MAG: dihydroorotase [Candidatus Omnitrophica bacterium]|nr:dihydroorotase [Candidatus Omnitrophota bacterium]